MKKPLKERIDDLLVKIALAGVIENPKQRLIELQYCSIDAHFLTGEPEYQAWYIEDNLLE